MLKLFDVQKPKQKPVNLADSLTDKEQELAAKEDDERMLAELDDELVVKIMPCNVSTHWNSTFDMLSFALEYQNTLVALTSDH